MHAANVVIINLSRKGRLLFTVSDMLFTPITGSSPNMKEKAAAASAAAARGELIMISVVID